VPGLQLTQIGDPGEGAVTRILGGRTVFDDSVSPRIGYGAAWHRSADPRVREDRRRNLALFVVIWILKRSIRHGAIVKVPAAKALTLADAGHQLAGVHRGPVVGNSVARGRCAGARATARRKAGAWCYQWQDRCKRDCRTQSSQIFHRCSISSV